MAANKIFEYPILIRERHLDTFAHVNNATYLEIYEEARWEVLREGGYTMEKIRSSQFGPIVLDIQIRFLKEIRLRTEILVKTELVSYTGKTGKLKQRMEGRNGEIFSDLEMTVALFDMQNRKIAAPTAEWLEALGMKADI